MTFKVWFITKSHCAINSAESVDRRTLNLENKFVQVFWNSPFIFHNTSNTVLIWVNKEINCEWISSWTQLKFAFFNHIVRTFSQVNLNRRFLSPLLVIRVFPEKDGSSANYCPVPLPAGHITYCVKHCLKIKIPLDFHLIRTKKPLNVVSNACGSLLHTVESRTVPSSGYVTSSR